MQLHTSLEGRVKLLLALAVQVANVVQRHGLALHGVVLAVPRLDRFDLYTHHAGRLDKSHKTVEVSEGLRVVPVRRSTDGLQNAKDRQSLP